jgi:hypothetical protein
MKFLLGTMWVMIRPATSAILIALRVELTLALFSQP